MLQELTQWACMLRPGVWLKALNIASVKLAHAVEVDYGTFYHYTDNMSNVSILCEQLYDMNRDMPTMTGKATYTRCHLIRTLFAVRQLVLPVKFFQVPAHML